MCVDWNKAHGKRWKKITWNSSLFLQIKANCIYIILYSWLVSQWMERNRFWDFYRFKVQISKVQIKKTLAIIYLLSTTLLQLHYYHTLHNQLLTNLTWRPVKYLNKLVVSIELYDSWHNDEGDHAKWKSMTSLFH